MSTLSSTVIENAKYALFTEMKGDSKGNEFVIRYAKNLVINLTFNDLVEKTTLFNELKQVLAILDCNLYLVSTTHSSNPKMFQLLSYDEMRNYINNSNMIPKVLYDKENSKYFLDCCTITSKYDNIKTRLPHPKLHLVDYIKMMALGHFQGNQEKMTKLFDF